MSQRHFDVIILVGLAALVIYGISLVPDAMDAQADHNRDVAVSRCIVNGDFDDSTEYCRAVAREMGQ